MEFSDLGGAERANAFASFHADGEGDQVRAGMRNERFADLLAVTGDDVDHSRREVTRKISARLSSDRGVSSLGLRMMVLPAMSAGATFQTINNSG